MSSPTPRTVSPARPEVSPARPEPFPAGPEAHREPRPDVGLGRRSAGRSRAGLAVLRAELRRAVQGRQLALFASGAVFLCLVTGYSLAVGAKDTALTAAAAGTLVESQARSWMMTFLFAGLFASMVFTRDLGTGALTRSVLTASRRAVFTAKATVAALVGAAFGLGAAALAIGSTYAMNTALSVPFVWTEEATLIVLGIGACCVLAALFGLFVGMLTRHATGALMLLLVQTLLLEPGLQRLAPDVAKYLFTISLSSIYRDVLPNLLSVPLAWAVALGWVVVAGGAAWSAFSTKDIGS